jgi:hypothetical protein
MLSAHVSRAVAILGYIVGGVAYLIGWFPIALWCSALAGACRTRIVGGRWPTYDPQVGPAHLAVGSAGWLTTTTFVVSLAVLAVGSALLADRMTRPRWSWVLCAPLVLAIGWGVFALLLSLDPGGILEWWMD